MGVAVGRRRVGGRVRMVAALLAALVGLGAGTPVWADLKIAPVSDKTGDDKTADETSLTNAFDKALDDAAAKSPSFKALLEKVRDDHGVTVTIHVRKDKSPWIDAALEWDALGVTDLNLTNLLRFPNPVPDKTVDIKKGPSIRMPDGFPAWAVTRTEILYHILDEAYLGAQDAAAKKLKGDEKDYDNRLAGILEINHKKAIAAQAAVRTDFGQGFTVDTQSIGVNGGALPQVTLGGKKRSPKVRFTFRTPSKFGSQNEAYVWYAGGVLEFGFYSGKFGRDGRQIDEPDIPDGGYAMADTPGSEDQPQYAGRDNLGTPQAATEDSDDAGMTPLESAVLADINQARTHPADYARQLAASGPQTAVTREAIAYLNGLQPLAPLAANIRLIHSAQKDAADEGAHGLGDHIGSDGSTATQRMQREGVFASVFEEEISFGKRTADAVVRQLVIDPDNPRRAHRTDLFDPLVRLAGVGCGPHTTMGALCVIDITSAMLGD